MPLRTPYAVALSLTLLPTMLATGCHRRDDEVVRLVVRDAGPATTAPLAADAEAWRPEGPEGAVEGTVRLNGQLGRFPAIALDSGTAGRAGCRDAATRIYTNPFPIDAPGPMPEALVTVDARSSRPPPRRRRVATFHDCSISPRVMVMSLNDQIVLHAETDAHPVPKVDGLGATIAQVLFRGTDQEPAGMRRPGRYILHSVLHPLWMQTPLLVTPNWFYDQSDASGRFRVEHLPPGTYTMHAWYPGTAEVTASVTIRAGETARQDFTLTAMPIERIAPLQPAQAPDAGPAIP